MPPPLQRPECRAAACRCPRERACVRGDGYEPRDALVSAQCQLTVVAVAPQMRPVGPVRAVRAERRVPCSPAARADRQRARRSRLRPRRPVRAAELFKKR